MPPSRVARRGIIATPENADFRILDRRRIDESNIRFGARERRGRRTHSGMAIGSHIGNRRLEGALDIGSAGQNRKGVARRARRGLGAREFGFRAQRFVAREQLVLMRRISEIGAPGNVVFDIAGGGDAFALDLEFAGGALHVPPRVADAAGDVQPAQRNSRQFEHRAIDRFAQRAALARQP